MYLLGGHGTTTTTDHNLVYSPWDDVIFDAWIRLVMIIALNTLIQRGLDFTHTNHERLRPVRTMDRLFASLFDIGHVSFDYTSNQNQAKDAWRVRRRDFLMIVQIFFEGFIIYVVQVLIPRYSPSFHVLFLAWYFAFVSLRWREDRHDNYVANGWLLLPQWQLPWLLVALTTM